MAVQSKMTIPLYIIPHLAGCRVPCVMTQGATHSVLASGPSAPENCCLANTALEIANAITDQLKVVLWECFGCQTQNVTDGLYVSCGLTYRASVHDTAKVWVHYLANAPIDFLSVATILMSQEHRAAESNMAHA